MWPNVLDQRPRASDAPHEAVTLARNSLQPACWHLVFDSFRLFNGNRFVLLYGHRGLALALAGTESVNQSHCDIDEIGILVPDKTVLVPL